MIGGSCLCMREIGKNYMQQQEARLRISVVPTTSADSLMNICAMLEMTTGLAIKKTMSNQRLVEAWLCYFKGEHYKPVISQALELFLQSDEGLEVVHAQCVANKLPVHRLSKLA